MVESILENSPSVFVHNERCEKLKRSFFRPYLDRFYELSTAYGPYKIFRRVEPVEATQGGFYPDSGSRPLDRSSFVTPALSPCQELWGRVITLNIATSARQCLSVGPLLRVGSGGRLDLTASDRVALRNGFAVAQGGTLTIRVGRVAQTD
jgi:adhesin HecA-like repeat protein